MSKKTQPEQEEDDFDFDGSDEEDTSSSVVGNKRKRASISDSNGGTKPHPPIPILPYTDRVFILHQPSPTTTQDNNNNNNNNNQDNSILDYNIISLPHPKKNTLCRYMTLNKQLLEISKFHNKPSSWFIDNSVRYDGSLYVTTPIDTLYLLLPFLEKMSKQVCIVVVVVVV